MIPLALRGWLMPDESLSPRDNTIFAVCEIIAFALGWNAIDSLLAGSQFGWLRLLACAGVSYFGFKWRARQPWLASDTQRWAERIDAIAKSYRVLIFVFLAVAICAFVIERYNLRHWTIAPPAPPVQRQHIPVPNVTYPNAVTQPVNHPIAQPKAEIPTYEEGSPNGSPEDPSGKRDAQLAAMQRVELAAKITDVTRKMREYERSWIWIGPQPPDSPSVEEQDDGAPEHKARMAKYWQDFKDWQDRVAHEVVDYQRQFFVNFNDDLPILNEFNLRLKDQLANSTECHQLFDRSPFEKGQLNKCADYLDAAVRDKLD